MSTKVRDLTKMAALRRSTTFIDLVLIALQHELPEDKELVAAIQEDLEKRRPQGRPPKES